MLLTLAMAQEKFAPNAMSYLELYTPLQITIAESGGERALTILLPKDNPRLPGKPLAKLGVRSVFFSEADAEAYFFPPPRDSNPQPVAGNGLSDPSGELSSVRGLFYAERYGLF